MAAFARTPGLLRDIDRFYPRYRDIRDAQGPIEALDLLWWPSDEDGRQLVWQGRAGPIGPIYPPWQDGAAPVTLHYRRLCELQEPDFSSGSRPAAKLSITGTHSTAWPGPVRVSEDLSMWRMGAEGGAGGAGDEGEQRVYVSPVDSLRAVATFGTTLSASRLRFDYFFGQPTPILYTVISATGAWATATNVVITYDSGSPLREVAVVRGNRE
jgi:hypothetical protein